MVEGENSAKRLVSHKISIASIVEGEFIKLEGWEPSYILTKSNKRVSRVNLLGTVVSVSEDGKSAIMDDSTASISLRSFGETEMPKDLSIGNIVMVIGRVRKYGEEIYIAPEIVKKIDDPRWIRVRQLEMINEEGALDYSVSEEKIDNTNNIFNKIIENKITDIEDKSTISKEENVISDVKLQEMEDASENDKETPGEKVCRAIKQLDTGRGADIDEIIEMIGAEGAGKIIQTLLEEGEIFEIRPGKYKVLE